MNVMAPLTPPADFVGRCAESGIEFEGDDLARLGKYLAVLLDANTKINLTSIDKPDEAWSRHIFDSLTLMPLLAEIPENGSVVDVGSGGGLPGMVLAIIAPSLSFTLLEATGKKVTFLKFAAAALGLTNVTVVADRAETAGHNRGTKVSEGPRTFRSGGHREKYDLVTARAVGRMAMLAELTVPFAKIGGRVALIKGQQADEELAEAGPALHLLKAIHTGTIDTPTGRIVVLEKSSATPRDYPRRDGEPKRAPLGIEREKERPAAKVPSKPPIKRPPDGADADL
jgi:16S rRNA (guanine527-N7)-methyltransferase